MLSQLLNPSSEDVIFSLKTFAAAVTALLICYTFNLEGPQWAFTSVYIIANPLSGASGSKALYRLLGTAAGGAATIASVPNLVDAPEILSCAVALWVAVCLMISLVDRTPKSYAFMLAGYTAALTAFPIVDTPDSAFTYATGRTLEIGVAIICTLFFNTLIFPKSAHSILANRTDGWLKSVQRLTVEILRQENPEDMLKPLAAKLAAEATDIRLFSTHAFYDGPEARASALRSSEMHDMMIAHLPILSSIQDALAALRTSEAGMTDDVRELLNDVAAWMETSKPISDNNGTPLWNRLDALTRACSSNASWTDAIRRNLVIRLQDLMQTWSDCLDLRDGEHPKRTQSRLQARLGLTGSLWNKHQDYTMVLFSGICVALTVGLGCFIWIETGWSAGGGMVLMSTIIMCFFAAMDNAKPIIRTFIGAATFTGMIAFIIQFAIMPMTDSFTVMVTALGCFCIPVGLLVAKPQTFLLGMAMGTSLPNMLSLTSTPSHDAINFLNSNFAMIAGMVLALVVTVLIKTLSTEWSAGRLLHAGWTDIRDVARAPSNANVTRLLHRMLDRLGQLAPRINALPSTSHIHGEDILKDLRTGFNLIELHRHLPKLAASERAPLENLMHEMDLHYGRKIKGQDPAKGKLIEALDEVIEAQAHQQTTLSRQIARACTSLRYTLFPAAADFKPASPINAQEQAA